MLPEGEAYHPAYVVWELTLRCDHACAHCGSRAAAARDNELGLADCLAVVESLASMGTKEVVLIGGEAYLHDGFLEIVRALSQHGITPVMTSGGMGITHEKAKEMAAAGMKRISISVDGMQDNHTRMRRNPKSFLQTTNAIKAIAAAGLDVSANTNFNRLNEGDLESLYTHFVDLNVRSWQIQITAALGRAADHPEMLFQPADLLQFLPRVAALKRQGFKDGLLIMPGNNLGYFGKEEALLRSPTLQGQAFFKGCQAGKYVMGIESNGSVKGCPSLQSDSYIGGSLREMPLSDIWQNTEALAFRREGIELWGFCKTCVFAETCQGGCSFTAHALFGKPGNNPYCHFRAGTLAKKGLKERLVLKKKAPGTPFDHGLFELVKEPFDTPDVGVSEHMLRML